MYEAVSFQLSAFSKNEIIFNQYPISNVYIRKV